MYKFAVRKTEEICRRLLARNEIDPSQIDLFISHQANRRIIMSVAEKLGLAEERVIINIERFGNTTAATIPLAMDDAVKEGRLKKGDLILSRRWVRIHRLVPSDAVGALKRRNEKQKNTDSRDGGPDLRSSTQKLIAARTVIAHPLQRISLCLYGLGLRAGDCPAVIRMCQSRSSCASVSPSL